MISSFVSSKLRQHSVVFHNVLANVCNKFQNKKFQKAPEIFRCVQNSLALTNCVKTKEIQVNSYSCCATQEHRQTCQLFAAIFSWGHKLFCEFSIVAALHRSFSKSSPTFKTDYLPSWTQEIFTVTKIIPRVPPVYRL